MDKNDKDNEDDKRTKEKVSDFEKELEDIISDTSFDDKLEEMGLKKPSKEEFLQEELAEKDEEIAKLKTEIANRDKKVEELQTEVQQLKELAKSANRQRERLQEKFNQQSERKIQKFIKEHYLPTVDSLENALQYITGEQDIEGIKGILTNCYNELAAVGIVKIEAKGQKFDPEYHDALAVGSDKDKEDNTILSVQETGYKNENTGELVRPAKVIVNKHS